MASKLFEHASAVRGFHYFRKYWQPTPNQVLECTHKKENPYDFFAIKACDIDRGMFVHLSIFSKFCNINASLAVTCHYFHIQNTTSFNRYGSDGTVKGSKSTFLPGAINLNISINYIINCNIMVLFMDL